MTFFDGKLKDYFIPKNKSLPELVFAFPANAEHIAVHLPTNYSPGEHKSPVLSFRTALEKSSVSTHLRQKASHKTDSIPAESLPRS